MSSWVDAHHLPGGPHTAPCPLLRLLTFLTHTPFHPFALLGHVLEIPFFSAATTIWPGKTMGANFCVWCVRNHVLVPAKNQKLLDTSVIQKSHLFSVTKMMSEIVHVLCSWIHSFSAPSLLLLFALLLNPSSPRVWHIHTILEKKGWLLTLMDVFGLVHD
jgi:hypothetical protein